MRNAVTTTIITEYVIMVVSNYRICNSCCNIFYIMPENQIVLTLYGQRRKKYLICGVSL